MPIGPLPATTRLCTSFTGSRSVTVGSLVGVSVGRTPAFGGVTVMVTSGEATPAVGAVSSATAPVRKTALPVMWSIV
jgi:hypothetical protein